MSSSDSLFLRFGELLDNSVLTWGLVACGIAQLLKLVFELIINKRWRPLIIFETGGMPSSHSALVTGTAAGIGWEMGFDHPVFAFSVAIAFIVMYDASGIRRAAGLTAERVNLLPSSVWNEIPETDLKETLGHTRVEVLVGSLIGPIVALPGIVFIGSPLHLIQALNISFG